MPVVPDPDRNLLHGLSDFWVAFFRDTGHLHALYEGTQLLLGQTYLDLLDAVLGTSLEHVPLFSRKYFTLLTVREDELVFVEGASTADDRFAYVPPEALAEARMLLNRVISPTSVLEHGRDYELADSRVLFRRNPLRGPNDGVEPGFPLRTVRVQMPATLRHQQRQAWASLGVQPGDTLRLRVRGGAPTEATVRLRQDDRLHLDPARDAFRADLSRRTWTAVVLRTPHDAVQTGVAVPGQARSYRTVTATPQAGTKTVAAADAAASWIGQYLYLKDDEQQSNTGFYRVTAVGAGTATLARATDFVASAGPFTAAVADLGPSASNTATFFLGHTFIDPGSVAISARRALTPGAVAEGVDYTVDYEAGTITYLTVWDPRVPARASYTWRLEVARDGLTFRGTWHNATSYVAGDAVVHAGVDYVCLGPSTGDVPVSSPGAWRRADAPFTFDETPQVRETALWAPDALVDREVLYTNFGYLLAKKRPTSERYRAFLRGVAQLFVLGPTIERLESALNVMAGYPVVRTDGEVLRGYDDGVHAAWQSAADDGEFIDTATGRDGAFDASAGTFSSPTAGFFTTDAGAVLAVRTPAMPVVFRDEARNFVTAGVVPGDKLFLSAGLPPVPKVYTIQAVSDHELVVDPTDPFVRPTEDDAAPTALRYSIGSSPPFYNNRVADHTSATARTARSRPASHTYQVLEVLSPTSATVTPAPTVNHRALEWTYTHNARTRLFRVAGGHAFTDADLDAEIVVEGSAHAHNNGAFRIVAVESSSTVLLDAPHGLIDERGVRGWRLTRSKRQRVTTSRADYDFPFAAPVRKDLKDPANVGTLTLSAFDTLTDAFRVVDYVSDPTWWHNVTIPRELLQLETDAAGRRRVTPQLIEHVMGALDGAVVGDLGLRASQDDEGRGGTPRTGAAVWVGGTDVTLEIPGFTPSRPPARLKDVGKYVHVPAGAFAGSFKVLSVSDDGHKLTLERFPPPEAAGLTAPHRIEPFELPPLLFRRSVAFVMMDRLLKYHAMRVKVDTRGALDASFLDEVAEILRDARPAHTYVYLDPPTSLSDRITAAETLTVAFGPEWTDVVALIDTALRFDSSSRVGDRYSYTSQNATGAHAGGAFSHTLAPSPTFSDGGVARTIPSPHRVRIVFARVSVQPGGTGPYAYLAEGRDYAIDYDTGQITAAEMAAGNWRVDYVACFLRSMAEGDPHEAFETNLVVGGADPLVRLGSGMGPDNSGLLDRALQINIT